MRLTEWRQTCVLLVTVGVILTTTNLTHADEPRYRVELHAPKYLPNCTDPEGFAEELDLALGHSLLDEAQASRVLEVRIERPNGSEYAVDVVITDVDAKVLQSRTLRFPGAMECFKVLHKVAFVAAIEMEKDLPHEHENQANPTSSPTRPTTRTLTPAAPARCPAQAIEPILLPEKSTKRKRAFVGLGVGTYLNVAPEAFFAPQVRLGWYVRPRVMFELDVAGQAWMTTKPQDGLTSIAIKTGIATLAGCYSPRSFLLCGLLSIELRHTSSREQIPETKLLPIVGLRAGYDHALGESLLLRTNLDVFMYLRDREIEARTSTLWEPIPLATNLATSIVWKF
jgi:hypothetical protein